jgi:hypothetical protein
MNSKVLLLRFLAYTVDAAGFPKADGFIRKEGTLLVVCLAHGENRTHQDAGVMFERLLRIA